MKQHHKFISIKQVLNRILSDEPHIKSINLGDAVEWAGTCLNLLGVNSVHKSYICTVSIENYRGELPENFKDIEAVREVHSNVGLTETINKFPYSETENTKKINELKIVIEEDIIKTEFETGTLEVRYIGYNLDEEGFPKIPDEERIIQLIYWYITYKETYKLWVLGKVKDSLYVKTEQEYLHYMRSARNNEKIPDKTQMQAIVDQTLQLVPNQYKYTNNFVDLENIDKIELPRR